MILEDAKKLIIEKTNAAAEFLKEKGLKVTSKLFYCDSNLSETVEFEKNSIMIFGTISVGTDELEDDEYCNFAICCEIKTALVDDEKLANAIDEFDAEIKAFDTEISAAVSVKDKLIEISDRQQREGEQSLEEFNREMRSVKLKLYIALGVLAIIAMLLLFSNMLFK